MSERAALAALLIAALLALRLSGLRRAGTALILLGIATIALNLYRIGPRAFSGNYDIPVFTFSDLLLGGGLLLLLPAAISEGWARRDWCLWRSRRGRRHALPVVAAVALITGGGLIGTFSSPDVEGSLVNILQFATASLGLIALVAVWSPSVRQIRLAAALLVASVLVSALAGVLGLDYWVGRVRGLTYHPNQLGALSAIAAGPAIAIALSLRGRRPAIRATGATLLALLALTMLVAGSRTGLVASAAVVLSFGPLLRVPGLLTARVAVGALAAGVALSLTVMLGGFSQDPVSRLFHDDAQLRPSADAVSRLLRPRIEVVTNDERIAFFSEAESRIEGSPFFGSGFHDVQRTHNIYLQLWAAAGLAGLAGMIALPLIAVSWLRRAARALRSSEPGSDRRATALLLFGLAAGSIGYAVSGLFEPTLWERWVWITPALAIATLRHLEGDEQPSA